ALIQRVHPFCGIVSNVSTGSIWTEYQAAKAAAAKSYSGPPATIAERHRREDSIGLFGKVIEYQRANTAALLKVGCRLAISSDSLAASSTEFRQGQGSLPRFARPGVATLLAIEGLVELGATPMQALLAGTRNGAQATRIADLGTIEPGKLADL